MSKLHFCVEVGSCHMNKKEYVEESVKRALDVGASSVKFQLFKPDSEFAKNNIALDRNLFEYAVSIGDGKVTASCFDEDSLDFLLGFTPPYVKFAFSQRHQAEWIDKVTEKAIVTVVTGTIWDEISCVVKLVTAIENNQTLYPNPYMMDFSGLFPHYFQGYSDHSIGWHNAYQSKLAGAEWIEKHLKLNRHDILCPDAVFASSDWGKIKHFL